MLAPEQNSSNMSLLNTHAVTHIITWMYSYRRYTWTKDSMVQNGEFLQAHGSISHLQRSENVARSTTLQWIHLQMSTDNNVYMAQVLKLKLPSEARNEPDKRAGASERRPGSVDFSRHSSRRSRSPYVSSLCPGGVKSSLAASSLLSKALFASRDAKGTSNCKRTRLVYLHVSDCDHVVKSLHNNAQWISTRDFKLFTNSTIFSRPPFSAAWPSLLYNQMRRSPWETPFYTATPPLRPRTGRNFIFEVTKKST